MPRAFMTGGTIGGVLMYVLDPVSGARRRALIRDRFASMRRDLEEGTGTTWRDARNRLRGIGTELRTALTTRDEPPQVLEERIRAATGTLLRFPRLVRVEAKDGIVTLSGAISADEASRFALRVR